MPVNVRGGATVRGVLIATFAFVRAVPQPKGNGAEDLHSWQVAGRQRSSGRADVARGRPKVG